MLRMTSGASSRRPSKISIGRRTLRGILASALVCISVTGYATQHSAPRPVSRQQSSEVSPNLLEAEELLRQGLVDQAKEKIREELQRNPSSLEGYNLLGIVCTDQKDYANGLDGFQQALKLDANSTGTLNNLGNLYVAQEKLDLAEKEFRKVLRLEPGNRDGNYNLGLVLMAKGSPAEAIAHFQRVCPLDVATRFNLTRAYLRAGRTAEGLKMVTELSAQNKDDVQVHSSLGVLLAYE